MPMDELWDIARIAAYLGVTERTIYNRVRAGDLPAIKVGRLWRVRQSDLEAWLGIGEGGAVGVGTSVAAEPGVLSTRAQLEAALADVVDPLERRLVFVGALSSAVESLGWPAPFVVGGHAVEFYTAGGYTTVDIDLAGASEPVAQTMAKWGFVREGRHWYDDALGLVAEVPSASLTPAQRSHAVTLRIGGTTAHIIGIEDLVVDRLAACVHWDNAESCGWAARLLAAADDIDMPYLRSAADAEQVSDALDIALKEAGRA
jgi:excisionase family DNA binding protein